MQRIDHKAIRHIANMIADTDDRENEPGFWDTLDGETDVLDIADRLIAETLTDDALVDAMKAEEKALKDRRDRIEYRLHKKREALGYLLDVTGVKKMERPRATISRRPGSERVEIVDESSIPSQLCTIKTTTTPDKTAIKDQLKAGVDVPGAILSRGPDSLSMRVL